MSHAPDADDVLILTQRNCSYATLVRVKWETARARERERESVPLAHNHFEENVFFMMTVSFHFFFHFPALFATFYDFLRCVKATVLGSSKTERECE